VKSLWKTHFAQFCHLPDFALFSCPSTAGHCGFMLPSSSGSSAIGAGYGVNLKTMFVRGFWAAAIALPIISVGAYLLIAFWPGFGYA